MNSRLETERQVLQEMLASVNKQLKMRETELKAEKKKLNKMEKINLINQQQQIPAPQ